MIIVSLSGGKDSTAVALLALDRQQPDTRFIFADTGHEHALTYEYVRDYLPARLGITIDTVRADFTARIAAKRIYIAEKYPAKGVPQEVIDRALAVIHPTGNPFLDLCLWKGRFPSRKAQFCTQELKRRPLDDYLLAHLQPDRDVESWRGVRRDKSQNRRNALARELQAEGWWIINPIVDWTAARVIAFVQDRGVELNPLYRQGMRRVGCMPCINCSKGELFEISQRFPEYIDKIREWERLLCLAAKRGWTTFFTDGADESESDAAIFDRLRIDSRVEWAKTTRGGKQYDLLANTIEPPACSSVYGLCE